MGAAQSSCQQREESETIINTASMLAVSFFTDCAALTAQEGEARAPQPQPQPQLLIQGAEHAEAYSSGGEALEPARKSVLTGVSHLPMLLAVCSRCVANAHLA
jgi:hypothetical protein